MLVISEDQICSISARVFQIVSISKNPTLLKLIFVLFFLSLCLLISVNVHFWTLLEMLSAGLCWPLTVTETRASAIMASLITAHLFSVAAFKSFHCHEKYFWNRKAIFISVRGLICPPLASEAWCAFSPAASLFLWPSGKDNVFEGLRPPLWDTAAASLTNMN